MGIPDRFAYSMSKGAVRAMTLSVAKDFLDKNIRCNCISPARVILPLSMDSEAKLSRQRGGDDGRAGEDTAYRQNGEAR